MKWIFILLLGANVALFLWGWDQEQRSQRKVRILEPEIGSLPLLSERTAVPQPVVSAGPEEGPTIAAPVEPSVPAREPEPAVESPPEEEPAVAVAESEPIAEQDPSPPPVPVEPEPSPPQVEPPPQTRPLVAEVVEPPPPPPAPAVERSCGSIGPFEEKATARDAIARLVARDIDATLRPEQEERITGYWVIIPPYPTQREAIDAVAALREQGVVDLSRFYRGELKNGISLGVYRRERNAEMRRRQIAEKGFAAELLPRRKKRDLFYVDYQGERPAVEVALEQLRPQLGKATVASHACPHVATSGGIF